MFGLGFGEILIICGVALLVFGPEHLPELARSLGKTVAEFRRTMDEVKREIHLPPEKREEQIVTRIPQEETAVVKPKSNSEALNQSQPVQQEPVSETSTKTPFV